MRISSFEAIGGVAVSQHKATEERRYRAELVAVIGVGLLLAIIAVVVILSVGGETVGGQDEFETLPASTWSVPAS